MGMFGHAVVRRLDGAVFAHIHPVGTFSMAAQELFVSGKPPKNAALPSQSGLPAADLSEVKPGIHASHTNGAGLIGEISFPYAFPQPGHYRIWVQMKSQGRILTGVFDTTVAEAK